MVTKCVTFRFLKKPVSESESVNPEIEDSESGCLGQLRNPDPKTIQSSAQPQGATRGSI